MTYVVLFILAVVWAVYLVSWLRSRTETRNVNSISSFNRHLSILERTAPSGRGSSAGAKLTAVPATGAPVVVRRPTLSPAKKRRKDILTGLLVASGVTLLGALFIGGVFRLLFVAAALLTVAYVTLLFTIQRRLVEQRTKVRRLATSGLAATEHGRARPSAWTDDWSDVRWAEQGEWDDPAEADGTYGCADERYVAAQS